MTVIDDTLFATPTASCLRAALADRPTPADLLAGRTAPIALADRPRWAVAGPDKKPYQPNGRAASSTDATTWSPLAACLSALAAHPDRYDRLYYALGDGATVAIDLDHCVVNGEIDAAASRWIDHFASYAELSPSGSGVRILLRGSLAGLRGNKRGHAEVYDRDRFISLTGAHIDGTPTAIAPRQPELEAFHAEVWPLRPPRAAAAPRQPVNLADAALLNKARHADDGGKLARLLAGDLSDYADDDSAADFALATKLAWWTGHDAARVERIMRASGLAREKWEETRGATTYLALTIAKACDATDGQYTPPTWPDDADADLDHDDFNDDGATVAQLRAIIARQAAELRRLRHDGQGECPNPQCVERQATHSRIMGIAHRADWSPTFRLVSIGIVAEAHSYAERYPLDPARPDLSPDVRNLLADGYQLGPAQETIARTVGVSVATVARVDKRLARAAMWERRQVILPAQRLDPATGEITGRSTRRTFYRFAGDGAALDALTPLATLPLPTEPKPDRPARPRPVCPACGPDAGVAWHKLPYCQHCAQPLGTASTAPAPEPLETAKVSTYQPDRLKLAPSPDVAPVRSLSTRQVETAAADAANPALDPTPTDHGELRRHTRQAERHGAYGGNGCRCDGCLSKWHTAVPDWRPPPVIAGASVPPLPEAAPGRRCYACGSSRWWTRPDGSEEVCAVCHPPPRGAP